MGYNGLDGVLVILFVYFCVTFILAIFAASIAENKGRNRIGWFIIVFFTGFIGLLFLLIAPVDEYEMNSQLVKSRIKKICPHCAEFIYTIATKCPYCHETQPKKNSEGGAAS